MEITAKNAKQTNNGNHSEQNTAKNTKQQQRHLTMTLEQARTASSKGSRGLFTAESQARDQNDRSDIMKLVNDRMLT
jgi:hypothetical protein